MKLIEFRESMRFVLAGAIATGIDFLALILFKEFVFPPTVCGLACAIGLAYGLGICIHYFFSAVFVFTAHHTNSVRAHAKKFAGFIIVSIMGLAWNEIGMLALFSLFGIDYRISKIIMTGVVMCWNYLMQRLVIFGESGENV